MLAEMLRKGLPQGGLDKGAPPPGPGDDQGGAGGGPGDMTPEKAVQLMQSMNIPPDPKVLTQLIKMGEAAELLLPMIQGGGQDQGQGQDDNATEPGQPARPVPPGAQGAQPGE